MHDLEKELLMSPTWKHRQQILIAEPFNIFEENLDNDLKKINRKQLKKNQIKKVCIITNFKDDKGLSNF